MASKCERTMSSWLLVIRDFIGQHVDVDQYEHRIFAYPRSRRQLKRPRLRSRAKRTVHHCICFLWIRMKSFNAAGRILNSQSGGIYDPKPPRHSQIPEFDSIAWKDLDLLLSHGLGAVVMLPSTAHYYPVYCLVRLVEVRNGTVYTREEPRVSLPGWASQCRPASSSKDQKTQYIYIYIYRHTRLPI